jgi:hypothetical protein
MHERSAASGQSFAQRIEQDTSPAARREEHEADLLLVERDVHFPFARAVRAVDQLAMSGAIVQKARSGAVDDPLCML